MCQNTVISAGKYLHTEKNYLLFGISDTSQAHF